MSDYKERMKKEYCELKQKYDRLHRMCIKYKAGTLDFKPSCSLELLLEQKRAMGRYLEILEIRAEIEKVNLSPAVCAENLSTHDLVNRVFDSAIKITSVPDTKINFIKEDVRE